MQENTDNQPLVEPNETPETEEAKEVLEKVEADILAKEALEEPTPEAVEIPSADDFPFPPDDTDELLRIFRAVEKTLILTPKRENGKAAKEYGFMLIKVQEAKVWAELAKSKEEQK